MDMKNLFLLFISVLFIGNTFAQNKEKCKEGKIGFGYFDKSEKYITKTHDRKAILMNSYKNVENVQFTLINRVKNEKLFGQYHLEYHQEDNYYTLSNSNTKQKVDFTAHRIKSKAMFSFCATDFWQKMIQLFNKKEVIIYHNEKVPFLTLRIKE